MLYVPSACDLAWTTTTTSVHVRTVTFAEPRLLCLCTLRGDRISIVMVGVIVIVTITAIIAVAVALLGLVAMATVITMFCGCSICIQWQQPVDRIISCETERETKNFLKGEYQKVTMHWKMFIRFFSARRYANAVYAVIVCPSVCPSVTSRCFRRLNLGSRKQRRTITQGLWFSDAKDLGEIPTESPLTGASNKDG